MQQIHNFIFRHPDGLFLVTGLLVGVAIPGLIYSNAEWMITSGETTTILIQLSTLLSLLCGITLVTTAAIGISSGLPTIDARFETAVRVGAVVFYITCGIALVAAICNAVFDGPERTPQPRALINLSLVRLLFAGVGAVALGWAATLQRPFNERFFLACLIAGAFIGYHIAFIILYVVIGGGFVLAAYRWGMPLLSKRPNVISPHAQPTGPIPQLAQQSADEQEILKRMVLARKAPVPEHFKNEELARLQQQLDQLRGRP